ncbi:major facilitator superfamily domain-containing protein [Mycotypha africana]|uniref:major facilitator superfamily domain-containing protein n=1 Tax=Mycotypha africana TaxID=64632 RepID=UPI002300384B|nr:major facilitator superfamily domain-containing protein [Mycotypha africana]KAI8988010.1 major facilitator superfamily domain-containing protein [Mycotypha africana]
MVYCVLIACLEPFANGWVSGSSNVPGTVTHVCEHGMAHVASKGLPDCLPMTTALWGFAVSSFCVGGLISALFGGNLQEKLGRRLTIIVNNFGFIIGSLLCCVAVHQAMFIIGRILCGISCGLGSLVVPTYIGEVSTIKGRGTMGTCNQFLIVIGLLLASAIGLPLAKVPLWRINYAITAFPAIAQVFLMATCAESPRWLVSKSRFEEARATLQKLRGNCNIEQEFYDMVEGIHGAEVAGTVSNGHSRREGMDMIDSKEGAEINDTTDVELKAAGEDVADKENMSMLQVMKDPVMRRIGFTVFVHHIIQQLSGMNAVMYYSTNIFLLAFNNSQSMAQLMAIITTIVNFVATIVTVIVIDRFGRRPLLLIAEAGTCIFSVLLVIGYKVNSPGLLIASVFLYVASFALGIGPIPWMITSEMTPTHAASAVGAASTCINWCMNFVIGQIFPVIFAAIEGWSFLIFAVICLLSFLFTFFFLPETKGRSIESIARGYEKYRK